MTPDPPKPTFEVRWSVDAPIVARWEVITPHVRTGFLGVFSLRPGPDRNPFPCFRLFRWLP